MSRFGISGASGRMGRTIFKIMLDRGHNLGAALDVESSPFIGQDAGTLLHIDNVGTKVSPITLESIKGLDGIIDFSAPAATLKLLPLAVEAKIPMVIGTTGFDEGGKAEIEKASKFIPILFSPNMSVGVNILFKLTEMAAKSTPEGYDIELFEAHHRLKKDAPSGTARKMLDIVKAAMPRLNKAKEINGRDGIVGARTDDEIGIQVMRGGDIVGEHTLFITGMGERIEITHRATSRDIFADGSVRAVEYISGKKPGMYSMYDVLGL